MFASRASPAEYKIHRIILSSSEKFTLLRAHIDFPSVCRKNSVLIAPRAYPSLDEFGLFNRAGSFIFL